MSGKDILSFCSGSAKTVSCSSEVSFNIYSTFLSWAYISFPLCKTSLNTLPFFTSLSTWISPCSILTNSFTSESPIPDEGCMSFSLDTVVKRSNIDGTLSLEMPIPSSFTAIETNCPLSITIKVIDLLSGVYLKALESKLKIIFSNLSLSIHKKTEGNVVWREKFIFFSVANNRKLSIILWSMIMISRYSIVKPIFLFCIFLKSNTWLMSNNIRLIFFWTNWRWCRVREVKGSWDNTSDTGPDIRVKGVRSSCEISIKERTFISANLCSIFTLCFK